MKLALLILVATLSSPALCREMKPQISVSLQSMEVARLSVKPLRPSELSHLYERVVAITRPTLKRGIASGK